MGGDSDSGAGQTALWTTANPDAVANATVLDLTRFFMFSSLA
jgi:hypothetical protein